MNKQMVDKYFMRYPKLEIVCCAGTISLKAAREIIGISRVDMHMAFLDLIEAEAIKSCGNACMRATPALKEYVAERRAKREGAWGND